jgi:hypothetical protein
MAGVPDPSGIVVQTAPVVTSGNIVVQGRSAPAFQPNAFQVPGFQTTQMSVDAFQKCAFDFQGFQTSECDENSARSGYWRLFFMNMQEEALKQYEEKTGKKVAKEPVVEEVVKKADVKVKKVKKPVVEEEVIPAFKPKPIYRPAPEESYLQAMWVLSNKVHQLVASFTSVSVLLKANQFKITQAANDADYRVRLLLLVA